MNKKQFQILVLVTAVSGVVGGAISERLFSAPQAVAAAKATTGKALTGSEFRLVDSKGAVQARIGFNADGLATVFWQYHGNQAQLQGKEQFVVIATLPGTQPVRKPAAQPPTQ
ncbi:MAG: hypothetical protein HY900_16680 [Deltaproteobacteria bacterium]|nr:hypothetical protein [Deltaproteobacteria bacterium]